MVSTPDPEQIKRWRLILGQHAQESLAQMGGAGGCQLSAEQLGMDEALAAIYDETEGEGRRGKQALRRARPLRAAISPSGSATSAPTSRKTSSRSSRTTPSSGKASRNFCSSRRCSRTSSPTRNLSAP